MRPSRQSGLSIVELLVGVAIGLFIVATAMALLVGRIQEHRALLLQSRLMQDLRVVADIVTRDLRRAGYWNDATAAIWHVGASGAAANPYTALVPAAAASDAVGFRFSRDVAENHRLDADEQFGFRLRHGTVEMLLGEGSWQALTDNATMIVTAFSVAPQLQEIPLHGFCANACPAGAPHCLPTQQVRSIAVTISGQSATDSRVVRTVRSQVRLRNDAIVGRCPA